METDPMSPDSIRIHKQVERDVDWWGRIVVWWSQLAILGASRRFDFLLGHYRTSKTKILK